MKNNHDPKDTQYSLGYLKIGQVDLLNSFGTDHGANIWKQMGNYLDIYQIECGDTTATYDYHWSNSDHELQQLGALT
jgi:hypothetical protein